MNKPFPAPLPKADVRKNAVLSIFAKLGWDAALAQCPADLKADETFLARCRESADKKDKPRTAGSLYRRTTPLVQRNALQSLVAKEGLDATFKKIPDDLLADQKFMAVCQGLDERRAARLRRVGKILDQVPERPLLYAPELGEAYVKAARRLDR